jgi:hypothetical protein
VELSEQQKKGIGVALNEATLSGAELDTDRRIAGLTFSVLTLPKEGQSQEDSRIQIILKPVSRVAASLRTGIRNNPSEVQPLKIEQLLEAIGTFKSPIYGWDFIDVEKKEFSILKNKLSLDWRSGIEGNKHTLSLFQEAPNRVLDLCFWFDSMDVFTAQGTRIELDDFIDGGQRWWDGLHSGDLGTVGSGITPLK